MSSSSRRRRRRRHRRESTSSAWAALPRDVLLDVFLRLGPREVMLGAEFVCRAWRRAALEEPVLWRRVGRDQIDRRTRRRCVGVGAESAMAFAAVERAAGQCEAFTGSCDDEDLMPLVERALSLKSLHVEHYSDYESGKVLVEALKKLTLLEDLQIYFKYVIYDDENMLRSVCQACPHLKKLVMSYTSAYDPEFMDDESGCLELVDGEIPMMHELRSLELVNCDLTCKGLKSILGSCPLLENLHAEGYFKKCKMDTEVRVKCARVKNLTLPNSGSHDSIYCRDDVDYDSTDESNDWQDD